MRLATYVTFLRRELEEEEEEMTESGKPNLIREHLKSRPSSSHAGNRDGSTILAGRSPDNQFMWAPITSL